MQEYFTIGWTIILYLFAIIGFFNAARSFYENFLRPEKPKLEIDVNNSILTKEDGFEITKAIKIHNISEKVAFRIRIYINNGGNKIILKRDSLKPAEEPIYHEVKTIDSYQSLKSSHDPLNEYLIIVRYKDGKENTYYSLKNGMSYKDNFIASKNKPNQISDFLAKVNISEKSI